MRAGEKLQMRRKARARDFIQARRSCGRIFGSKLPPIPNQVETVMTESAGVRVWIAGVALSLAVTGLARAQEPSSTPGTDVFANNSSPATVYEDRFSSNCDETNHSSLAMDSPDPAVCFDSPAAANGECSPVGGKDSTPAGQTGNICHYCQKAAMPGKEIIIPSSGGIGFGTPSYDWICTANPSDGCYMSCFGNLPTPTLPPGSSVQQETGQNGHPIFKITIANDDPCTESPGGPSMCTYPGLPLPQGCDCSKEPPAATQPTPDPCYPAGPKNYNACDYPNVARPAGCECSKTPGPQPVAQPTPQPTPQPTSQTPDERNYLQGLVDGIGSCLQNLQNGMVNLMAGAGYFAQGNFVQAAQAWGLQPGQSLVLQSLYTEMTTPQVSVVSNVSDYQRGLAGGKRLCSYVLIPAATKAIGSALKGGASGGGSPGGTPSGSKPGQAPVPEGSPSQLPGGPSGAPPPGRAAPAAPSSTQPTGSTQPTTPKSTPPPPPDGAPPPRTGSTQPTGPNGAPPPRTGSTQPTGPNGAPPPRTGGTQPTGPNGAPPPRTGSTQPTGPNGAPPPRPGSAVPTAPKSVPPPDKTQPTTPLGPDGTLPTAPGSTP